MNESAGFVADEEIGVVVYRVEYAGGGILVDGDGGGVVYDGDG